MGDLSPAFQEKLLSTVEKMINKFYTILHEAQQHSEISQDIDIQQLSSFMFDGLQGALIRMKLIKNEQALITYKSFIIDYIFNKYESS